MTKLTCQHCHAETTNGLALCNLCRRKLETNLDLLPIYYRNLNRWRPGRAGSRPKPGSRAPIGIGSGSEDTVIRALDETSTTIAYWAGRLAESRRGSRMALVVDRILTFEPERRIRLLCQLLQRRLPTISLLSLAGDLVDETTQHEQTLRRLTDRYAPGWYAGACRQCGAPNHVVPGLTWVTCRGCGANTPARDHLATVLAEARGWLATPRQIAAALVALLDDQTDADRLVARIRQWGKRGRVVAIDAYGYDPRLGYARDYDPAMAYRYRLGDILDALDQPHATRRTEHKEAS